MQTVQASGRAHGLLHAHAGLFERYDVLALPTAQVWPFPAEWRWPQSIAGRPMDTYHRWMEVVIYATFAGLPCIAMPVGFGAERPADGRAADRPARTATSRCCSSRARSSGSASARRSLAPGGAASG